MGGGRVSRELLTADVPRKNVEAMALFLLWVGPQAQRQVRALQQFIGEGRWDDEAILAEHQRQVNERGGLLCPHQMSSTLYISNSITDSPR